MFLSYNCNVSRHLSSSFAERCIKYLYETCIHWDWGHISSLHINKIHQNSRTRTGLSTQNSTALRTEITFLQNGESYSPLYLTFSIKNSIISFRYKTHCSAILDVLCQLHSSSRSFECFNFGTVPILSGFPFYGLAPSRPGRV